MKIAFEITVFSSELRGKVFNVFLHLAIFPTPEKKKREWKKIRHAMHERNINFW